MFWPLPVERAGSHPQRTLVWLGRAGRQSWRGCQGALLLSDSTPTHSYCKALYKYPQAAFPYKQLIEENARRGKFDREFELLDTKIFDDGRYFDVTVQYAKASSDDILIRLTITNHGPENAPLDLLPTLWFRNTWDWGRTGDGYWPKPRLRGGQTAPSWPEHASLGSFQLAAAPSQSGVAPRFLWTDNESNVQRLFNAPNPDPYVKDAFHEYACLENVEAVNPAGAGTKAAAHYHLEVAPKATIEVHLRLSSVGRRPEKSVRAGVRAHLRAAHRRCRRFLLRAHPRSLE